MLRCRLLRLSRGLTQKQVAAACGLFGADVSRVETNRGYAGEIAKVASYFGITSAEAVEQVRMAIVETTERT